MNYSKVIYILPLIVFLLVTGCSIEKLQGSSGEPVGSVFVTAVDSVGLEIDGASILIDGIERIEKTPAYVHGVTEGMHEILIRSFGFINDTISVVVAGADTVNIESVLDMIPADQSGTLIVNSSPGGARLLINGRTYLLDGAPVLTPLSIDLPWGAYDVSVHQQGYITASPILPRVLLSAGAVEEYSFSLEAKETGLEVDKLPFLFTLVNDEGDSIALSDLTGHVVLINFWYVDCEPCRDEFGGIENVWVNHAADGFRVLAVNPMTRDNLNDVQTFREEYGLTFQLLLDLDREVTINQYNVSYFPTNILIDRTGKISALMRKVEEAELEDMVVELLGSGEAAPG